MDRTAILRPGGKRTGFSSTEDEFEAAQQVRLQLDAAASERLSGTVQIELGGYNRRHGGSTGVPMPAAGLWARTATG